MIQPHVQPSPRLQFESAVGKTPRISRRKKVLLAIGFVFVCGLLVVAVYSSYELYKMRRPDYQQKAVERRTRDITEEVGRLVELPGDIPQVATVSDAQAIKSNQPFFERAENGDYLLIFQTEAILYRPRTGKIVNVAAVSRDQPAPSVPKRSSPSPESVQAE